jgi:hypothetical protein
MVSATPAPLSETLATPLGAGIALYLLIGLFVAGFIAFRGMRLRRPPNNGLLWDRKDNARNSLFLFQSIVLLSPIAFIIEIALWPLVLLFLWAYQSDDDETI